ncbi:MAG: glycosyltransferase family 39 protein [Steroidobacteraceae bacterium]
MKRLLASVWAPLVDAGLFCALIAAGLSLQASHMASFSVAMALNYLVKVRAASAGGGTTRERMSPWRWVAVGLMAMFLRGGVLGLLTLRWGWPPQVSILFAVLAGMAVTASGYAQALTQPDSGERARMLALRLIAYAFALRLLYLGSVELLPEEAYYWNYSRHLDFGYLDHPPMVAWLIRLGTAVFGQSQFGVRIGALGCGVVASLFAYRLTRNLFGEASALGAMLLAQTLPFFFLSGLLMTPDAPLTAAWAASLYYLERALLAGRRGAWWSAGLALGIGAISKYSIGLLVPVAAAFMLWDGQARRWWRSWEPYGAALLAAAIFSPVIFWNAEHGWASFAFQTSRRIAEASKFALHKLLASAIVLISPTGVLAVAASFAGDDGGVPRRRLFIHLALLLPLAVFAIFSLRHEVKLDWTGAPWTAALPVMAAGMISANALSGLKAWIRAAWVPTLVTLLLIYGAGLHYLVLGLPGIGYGKHIELIPVGWREFSRQVAVTAAQIRAETGADPLIVGMDRYAIASELAFYAAERTAAELQTSSAHLFDGIGLMYERWTPRERQEGRNLLLIAWDARELSGKTIESHAERWGPVEEEILTRDGRVVRRYYHRLAYNYRSVPRPWPALESVEESR